MSYLGEVPASRPVGVTERHNMTRVILSRSILDYRQGMAELVREVRERPGITGVHPRSGGRELLRARKDPPALRREGLLPPPGIETLDPYLFPAEDEVDGIIHITTAGEYGVVDVYVTLQDDRGTQIESGFALRDELEEVDWFYFPSAPLRPGASVTVRAIAMDPLGGIGTRDKTVTV